MIRIASKVVVLLMIFVMTGCNKSSTNPGYDPPADHTVSKDGTKHKPGLNDPTVNCTACHGADLRGGSADVSCDECHGKKW